MRSPAAEAAPTVPAAPEPRNDRPQGCWHCGDALPSRASFRALVSGAERAFCCAGCRAVATTIAGAGLDRYYATRLALSPAPRDDVAPPAAWSAASAAVVRARADGTREASLILDGLACGACAWLTERWLESRPGVVEARVNYATRRAEVAWRDGASTIDAILADVAAIGYRAHPYDPARREALARDERRALLMRTGIAWLAMMQVMMLALPGYLSDDGVAPHHQRLLDWASLVVTLPAVLYCAWPFFAGAWRDLERRRLGMDVPVALGLAAAFAASAASTLGAGGPVYYDAITMFVALLLAARLGELAVRQRSGDAIERAARSAPATAERYDAWPAPATTTVAAAALAPGDVVLVRAGETIPADGAIVDGEALVEEALLTGESWPQARGPGEAVLAGAIVRDRPLCIRVTAVGDATALAAIQRLVERASFARPRLARLADRAAGVFVAGLVVAAAITAVAWLAIDPARVVPVVFALLVVSCPCALSLATPSALAAAAGALGRRGVLLVEADAVEALARVSHVAFDKTGTLTTGRVRLSATHAVATRPDRALAIAAALEARSGHPIARALAEAHGDDADEASDVAAIDGEGLEGVVDGRRWRIGRVSFVAAIAGAVPDEVDRFVRASGATATVIALGDAQGFAAAFALGDALADGAAEAVASLRALGVTTSVLSGDRTATAEAFAQSAGITTARGDLSPDAKRDAIAALQRDGAVVAMVGDGVNDAPSLAQAQVSVALAGATPIAQWTADVVVAAGGLPRIADAIAQARRTLAVVRQNVAWATLYNAIAIPAAAFGIVTPAVAAAGMAISSAVVVANASRLLR